MYDLDNLSTKITFIIFFLLGMLWSFFYQKPLFTALLYFVLFMGLILGVGLIFVAVKATVEKILRLLGFRDYYDSRY